jgi:hypothetical protein
VPGGDRLDEKHRWRRRSDADAHRLRAEAKQGRVDVFLEGIQELERRVRAARRHANRKNAVRHPH